MAVSDEPTSGRIPALAFLERALLVAVAFEFCLRVRMLLESPVATSSPLLGLLLGLVRSAALLSIAGAFAVLLAGWNPSWAKALFASFLLVRLIVFFVWSEVVIYFGHPPRPLDSEVGFDLSFYTSSLWSRAGLNLAVLVVAAAAAMLWAAARARRAPGVRIRARTLRVAVAASAVVIAVPARIFPESSRDPLLEVARLARERRRSAQESRKPVAPLSDPSGVACLLPASLRGSAARGEYPFALRGGDSGPPSLPAGSRPNVVFLVLEGMQAPDLGVGAPPPGLTPNLDRLGEQGYRFERAYSSGTHTAEGELALWYGLLPLSREWLMPDRPRVALTGLPEILRALGWRDFVWMYGGDQTFYRRALFYGLRGFRYFDAADFPDSDVRTSWGFSDLSLARRSIAVLHAAAEPFAAMVVTISNHHPFRVPEDSKSVFDVSALESRCFGHYTCRMLQTMHYADEAVGDFFKRARGESWFARTIFVVVGDHGLPIEPIGVSRPTPHELEEFQHRVPMILYSPLLPGGSAIPGPVCQADVLPTLLHLIAPHFPRAGPGIDLFGRAREDRPIVLWSAQPRTVSVVGRSRTYHVVLKSGGAVWDPESEALIDPASDPRGTRDLSVREPETAAAARRVAREFLEDYPVLVDSGRSGLPPGSLERPTSPISAALR